MFKFAVELLTVCLLVPSPTYAWLWTPAGYTAELEFTGLDLIPNPAGAQTIFNQAKAKWERVITGDVPDVESSSFASVGTRCFSGGPDLPETIDDVYICSSFEDLPPGILGGAGPVILRGENGVPADGAPLTVLGTMVFDIAFTTDSQFDIVVLHEMGHVIGIGTLWGRTNFQTDGFPPPCNYIVNSKASQEYQALSGCTSAIPVEEDRDNNPGTVSQGSDCSHWDENCFTNELMTPVLSGGVDNPFSRITIASLDDMGYVVNYNEAESYTSNNLAGFCKCPGSRRLGEDVERPKRKLLSQEQIDARDAAKAWGQQQLVAKAPEGVITFQDVIFVAYRDPVTGDINSVVVRAGDE